MLYTAFPSLQPSVPEQLSLNAAVVTGVCKWFDGSRLELCSIKLSFVSYIVYIICHMNEVHSFTPIARIHRVLCLEDFDFFETYDRALAPSTTR